MEPFIGQVMMFGGNFAPRGWAFCQGQLLAISSNSALFSIVGTIYGGDGRTTFALPDLRGRIAIQHGNGPGLPSNNLGEKGGNATTTLLTSNLPPAQTTMGFGDDEATSTDGTGKVLSIPDDDSAVYADSGSTSLRTGTIAGALNTPFSNQPPFQAVNYIIALQGIYPSRN